MCGVVGFAFVEGMTAERAEGAFAGGCPPPGSLGAASTRAATVATTSARTWKRMETMRKVPTGRNTAGRLRDRSYVSMCISADQQHWPFASRAPYISHGPGVCTPGEAPGKKLREGRVRLRSEARENREERSTRLVRIRDETLDWRSE